MEPLDGAQVIVAQDHLAKGDLIADTVGRLVRINGLRRRRLLSRTGIGI